MVDIVFDRFRFDTASECLWRGVEMIDLTPKSYAVLRCLLEHAGQLVSKDVLLDAVWPDAAVTDASLKVCIAEIRRALGDQVAAPRFIATVHRRGYRFICAIDEPAGARDSHPFALSVSKGALRHAQGERVERPDVDQSLVGREAALATLQRSFDRARGGERQIVFVTGELGIGKSAVVEAFLARSAAPAGAALAYGRCIEHFGAGEAYLPFLDALGRLCREAGPPAVALLRERAPTWLVQMPWLVAEPERDALQREIFGGTQERMLREVTEALEALAAATPLVLVLEDLHWSDPSSLDALALLAQRREPARLLVIGTYRPVAAILAAHPVKDLKQRLALQRGCSELVIDFLSAADTAAYLSARLGTAPPAGLADVVHQRTDGNPLFMVMVVDELLASSHVTHDERGWTIREGLDAIAAAVPDGVRQMVERQIERLALPHVALLEAAALGRGEFSAALIAAALEADALEVEQRCEQLALAQRWIRASGLAELADGSVSGSYRFVYALYQSVLAQRIPPARRMRLHQRIGEWLEHTVGDEAAAELAEHFEQSRDAERAIRYLRVAARTAAGRYAHREAVAGLTRGLALVDRLPQEARGAARRALLEQRGIAHRAVGDGAAAVQDLSAWADSARADATAAEEVRALLALSAAWSLRDRSRSLTYADQAVERSRDGADPELHVRTRGYAAYWSARVRGWRPRDATASADALASARRSGHPGALAAHLGMHAYFANLQSDYAAAARDAAEGGALAERAGDNFFTHALCRYQQSWALLHAGEWGALLGVLHQAMRAAERNEHRPWLMVFTLVLAWWAACAGDSDGAGTRAEQILPVTRAAGHVHGTVLALLVSGWAALGRGAVAEARHAFATVADGPARHPTAMEWVLRLPLHLGVSACALAEGDAQRAAEEAALASALAVQPGERTYLALAQRARAAAAIAARCWDDAEVALAAARVTLASGAAPLAEWQVWSMAARLSGAQRRTDHAAQQRSRSAAVLDRLAASLDGVDVSAATALGVSIQAVQRSIRAQAP